MHHASAGIPSPQDVDEVSPSTVEQSVLEQAHQRPFILADVQEGPTCDRLAGRCVVCSSEYQIAHVGHLISCAGVNVGGVQGLNFLGLGDCLFEEVRYNEQQILCHKFVIWLVA